MLRFLHEWQAPLGLMIITMTNGPFPLNDFHERTFTFSHHCLTEVQTEQHGGKHKQQLTACCVWLTWLLLLLSACFITASHVLGSSNLKTGNFTVIIHAPAQQNRGFRKETLNVKDSIKGLYWGNFYFSTSQPDVKTFISSFSMEACFHHEIKKKILIFSEFYLFFLWIERERNWQLWGEKSQNSEFISRNSAFFFQNSEEKKS